MLTERWSFARDDSFGLSKWSLLPRASVLTISLSLSTEIALITRKKRHGDEVKQCIEGLEN
jgi:hypothetical protein